MFSETAQFDALGRLLKDIGGAAAQTWVYAHDKEENLISATQGANAWTYACNAANRMESESKNVVVQGTYVYNAMGQKVRRVASGVTTNVVHDVAGDRITVSSPALDPFTMTHAANGLVKGGKAILGVRPQ